METISLKGEVKDKTLYGQLSNTGKPFNEGYSVRLNNGLFYFSKEEESQRDKFLTENGIYDKETPEWNSLHESYEHKFYYSEWYVDEDMDGGYDEEGRYYLYDEGLDIFIEEE